MRFRKRKGLLFVSLSSATFFAIPFTWAVRHNRIDLGGFTLLFCMLIFLFFAYLSLFAVADITIDSDGFHRTLFDLKLFSIRWNDVELVTDRKEGGPNLGPQVRFITLVPKGEIFIGSFAKRSKRLDDGIVRFPEFIEAINAELMKHNIPVELSRNGKTVMQKELLLRIPEGQLWNPMRD